MQKYKNTLIIVAFVVVSIFFLFLAVQATNYYTRTALVVEVDGNLITVKEHGRLWQFYDDVGYYTLYDVVRMKMNINGTEEDITDDIIIKVDGHDVPEVQGYIGKK